VLISAGYGVRDIDDAIDSVLRPQDLKPLEPAKPKEQQESFFQKVPVWMIATTGGGIFLLIIIIVLLVPSGGEPTGLLNLNGMKISAYDFNCAGPASSLTITMKNTGESGINDVQLFKDDAFQAGKLISSLAAGASDTFDYPDVDCNDWLGDHTVKIISSRGAAEGQIKFTCSSGAC